MLILGISNMPVKSCHTIPKIGHRHQLLLNKLTSVFGLPTIDVFQNIQNETILTGMSGPRTLTIP
jgi:hypothetical protein